jgi:hypothetical protein
VPLRRIQSSPSQSEASPPALRIMAPRRSAMVQDGRLSRLVLVDGTGR